MSDISRLPEIKEKLRTLCSVCNNTAFSKFDNAFYFDQNVTEELKVVYKTVTKLLNHLKE